MRASFFACLIYCLLLLKELGLEQVQDEVVGQLHSEEDVAKGHSHSPSILPQQPSISQALSSLDKEGSQQVATGSLSATMVQVPACSHVAGTLTVPVAIVQVPDLSHIGSLTGIIVGSAVAPPLS